MSHICLFIINRTIEPSRKSRAAHFFISLCFRLPAIHTSCYKPPSLLTLCVNPPCMQACQGMRAPTHTQTHACGQSPASLLSAPTSCRATAASRRSGSTIGNDILVFTLGEMNMLRAQRSSCQARGQIA